jgi:thermitase
VRPALVLVLAASLALPASASADAVRGQLIVGFKPGTSSSAQSKLLAAAGARIRTRLAHIRAASIRPRSGRALSAVKTALRRSHAVAYVEPDFYLNATATPDDPLFAQQYGLSQPNGDDIAAPAAWDTDTACAKVAVVDSGVQTSHPDLKDNLWHNPGEVPNNGKDDDHNGYVDDYYGVDIVAGKGNAEDDNGHGTHVAGIIGGRGNNAVGVSGVCWSATIVPVKFMNARGKGSTSDAISALDYAIKENAKIVNCSFGSSSKSSSLQDEVDYAKSKGVLLVVAAGNDGENIDSNPEYPASFTEGNILTVAASTAQDTLASFSNYGKKTVDVAAPGDSILSTYPTSTYKRLSGTSMASPMVAGAAAMLKARRSSATYGDLKTALVYTGDAKPAFTNTVSGRRLNVASALNEIG